MFSVFAHAYCADVSKAYNRIKLAPKSRQLTCYWWCKPGKPEELAVFYDLVLSFGVSSASFLLELALRGPVADQCNHEKSRQTLTRCRLVDDILFSEETIEQRKVTGEDIQQALGTFDFPLKEEVEG